MMTGAELLIQCLQKEQVELIFAYPGATSMPLHQALLSSPIRVVLPRHEQGGAFAAEGYARATGKVGVCMATSGPGATNLVTGIADAYMDSIPLVAITAQVDNRFIGKNAFQETDIIGLTRPVVKHSYLVLNMEELPEIIHRAFVIAGTGRPGPVVVDVPYNFLLHEAAGAPLSCLPQRKKEKMPSLGPLLQRMRHWLAESRKPLLFAGGGVVSAGASAELRRFADENGIPVVTSLMGLGVYPARGKNSFRWLGRHGARVANYAAQQCDLLLGFGVRFSDRVTGDPERFAPHARIVQFEIDPSEVNKNKQVDFSVPGDLKHVLNLLLKNQIVPSGQFTAWHRELRQYAKEHPGFANETEGLASCPKIVLAGKGGTSSLQGPEVLRLLGDLAPKGALFVTGVGEHQLWAAQNLPVNEPRHFLTSGGLGAMGFGLPAAIGAQLARPQSMVILIDGDGSFQMNLQELATLFAEKLPIRILLMNNQCLGLVARWENQNFGGVHAHTDLRIGPQIYPDYCAIAKGYGLSARCVKTFAELKKQMPLWLKQGGLLEVQLISPCLKKGNG